MLNREKLGFFLQWVLEFCNSPHTDAVQKWCIRKLPPTQFLWRAKILHKMWSNSFKEWGHIMQKVVQLTGLVWGLPAITGISGGNQGSYIPESKQTQDYKQTLLFVAFLPAPFLPELGKGCMEVSRWLFQADLTTDLCSCSGTSPCWCWFGRWHQLCAVETLWSLSQLNKLRSRRSTLALWSKRWGNLNSPSRVCSLKVISKAGFWICCPVF